MAHAEHTVTVEPWITQVFAFLADGLNNPKWRPGVTDVSLLSSEDGLGSQYAQTMQGPRGRAIRGDYKVTRYDAPTRLDFEVIAGPARPTGTFLLEEVRAGGTKVTFSLDLKPRGLMILMAPMISKQMNAEVACLDNLERAMRP